MPNATEPSSTISFASSSYLSNCSSAYHAPVAAPSPPVQPAAPDGGTNLEVLSLGKLSSNLERLLVDTEFDCTDAEIMVEGAPVGVHRCILAARSRFFRELFSREGSGGAPREGKPRFDMNELVPGGRVGREAFMVFLSYLYTGKLKPAPQDVSICVDRFCAHDACPPAIGFAVELMYASSVFQIAELVSLLQRRLLNFVEKALVEDVIPILQVASHSKLNQLLAHCVQRVARSDLDDIALEKKLPQEVADEIRSLRRKSQPKESNVTVDPVHVKRIKRIHRALDSDDVELVKLLLNESGVTLDDTYALHYASAYCDSKVIAELLDLGSANVNLKNDKGCTPLHVAAMRREPKVIVSLLTKGASALETTADGQNAVRICRRLTRAKDYFTRTEQGQESNKNKLCIDILEREMRRNPMVGEDAVTSPLLADDLHMKLLYLENRVAFARLFFPAEAKVAMEIAHADTTSEFTGLSKSRSSSNLRDVDLNETPVVQNKRLRSRVDALMKTVELGRRYFPNCSQVLDKFLEDDLPDLFYLQKGNPDEQKIKKLRFCELKEDVRKAFSKDKAGSLLSGLSSMLSSSSPKD
ncbi:Regulatory protein NPR1 [Musa troglodytarum]|uniref:Regulatory protein NPR1 n=1 Tax=Musa troglodytarum TaxID=320322 RepID=A0A9E7FUS6_9LILI|nr:Regulatory protein NPR1 [Musa troglodytarum]